VQAGEKATSVNTVRVSTKPSMRAHLWETVQLQNSPMCSASTHCCCPDKELGRDRGEEGDTVGSFYWRLSSSTAREFLSVPSSPPPLPPLPLSCVAFPF